MPRRVDQRFVDDMIDAPPQRVAERAFQILKLHGNVQAPLALNAVA